MWTSILVPGTSRLWYIYLRMLYSFLKKKKGVPSLLVWNDPQDILLITTTLEANQYVFYERSIKVYAYTFMYIHKIYLKEHIGN